MAELTTRAIRQGFHSEKAYGLRVARAGPDAGGFLPLSGVYVALMGHLLWARGWAVQMGAAASSKQETQVFVHKI